MIFSKHNLFQTKTNYSPGVNLGYDIFILCVGHLKISYTKFIQYYKKSDESKKLSADKARMYRWITDGNKAKQWLKTEDIPKGYRAGRK